MRHSYDTDAIFKAMVEASDEYPGIRGMISAPFEAFLDALPEPEQNDWQECSFEDIRKGDRVRLVQAGRTTDFHLPVIETHPTHLVLRDNTQCSNFHKALYYRIPAPVQHPDPEEHEFIIIYGGEVLRYDGHHYYINREGKPTSPKMIMANWTPAEIVPKVVADDE